MAAQTEHGDRSRYRVHSLVFFEDWMMITENLPYKSYFPCGDRIVRARYRNGVNNPPALMKPGQIYEFTIELYPSSILFKRGHRIRLDISSSNFPRFDVNPNTGEPLNDNRRTAIAVNAISHDAEHPSRIELPLVSR